MNPVYLSICAIIRNEAPYIGEWIAFHRLVGVQRFYLFDDLSTDSTPLEIFRHDRGDIVLGAYQRRPEWECPEPVPFRATHQIVTFNRFIAEHRDETQWCAFIDPDEYLYHADHNDIREPLFEDVESWGAAALFVQWLVFGSSGHKRRPPGPTIAAYTQRGQLGEPEPTGRHGKLIARMDAIEYFGPFGSHNAKFRHGEPMNENGTAVTGPTNPDPSTNRWRLNHYYHRSAEEARERISAIDNNAVSGFHKSTSRMRRHDLNAVQDRDILRFLPPLMEALV